MKGFSQEELTSRQGLVAATYAKISAGTTSLDSIALLLRPLDLEFRDLPFPSRCRATITGLQAVVPLVRYEALCDIPPPHSAQQTLSREDVEWLFHLDLFGKAWEQASASSDARAGTIISTCAAASIALRLCKKIQTRPFTSLQQFRLDWFDAWEACLKAIPTGRME